MLGKTYHRAVLILHMQQYNRSLQMGCAGILEELDISTVSKPLSRGPSLSMQEPDDHLRLAHAITLNS
jgi:hypothetical protein